MIKIIDLRCGKDSDIFENLASRSQLEYRDVLDRVEEIVANVRRNGDKAVLEYTAMFDKVQLTLGKLRVTEKEIKEAYTKVDPKLVEVIKRSRDNIWNFHEKQKEKSWFSTEKEGVIVGQLYRPLEVVGVYVPGGTAAYPSSVLMCAVPAKVAGVSKIVMTTPPGKDEKINPAILVAANEAGVDEIYKVGGAQAVAALAFGTETIPKVDKIVGPGNIYVAMAKRTVYGYCDIDMIAGPSEIMVVADETANPVFVAADLLSQAEHDILASSILVTTSEDIAKEVQRELEAQLAVLERKEIAGKSIADYGAIIIVESLKDAATVVNRIAPEHLELCVKDPFAALGDIKNAGAIFLGNYSTEPLGDYFAGPNHVLPTSGTARFFSPLNLSDFMKKSSIISYTRDALQKVKDDVILFAESEGLGAHANAIRVRFQDGQDK
ncbi:histidinol dehydrogenase [Acetivibrio thermocellus AD2]|jgi:histidinol dehydrogenase|uniref:Histidinol dehydrogenase n=1 Tax=Acetivibrio thermocellus AD2 TaxID=1138384 RepID=A0AB36TCY8_ACETH|nr:histidinol dehydrogenase [Acetivibrio thermocellus]CDG37373.1 Histidinol dehydrogenase [Acetivibrio thermocellus BC1]ADU73512.1 histidinol dehydrogenase [Acetivibrio thermocellus DSM 1313]ALX07434.1 Histidinol dehydrogenase [Acetivibrio thermocellus AD2]ANV75173.1 Histidinol dehydrogenase [Acetivibrio thermocellus DSM 2360]EIC04099.1 histidinol dehydrogenase [Acetivibrio thermocellus YS]